jgi:hypothetical protein
MAQTRVRPDYFPSRCPNCGVDFTFDERRESNLSLSLGRWGEGRAIKDRREWHCKACRHEWPTGVSDDVLLAPARKQWVEMLAHLAVKADERLEARGLPPLGPMAYWESSDLQQMLFGLKPDEKRLDAFIRDYAARVEAGLVPGFSNSMAKIGGDKGRQGRGKRNSTRRKTAKIDLSEQRR